MTQTSETSDLSPEDWERIARYLTGEADAVEADATRRWSEEDAARLAVVQRTQALLATVRDPRPADIDVEAALRGVKQRAQVSKVIPISSRAKPAPTRRVATYMRVAAALLVVIGGLAVWRSMRPSGLSMKAQSLATGIGERRRFVLADGSGVVLGPASALEVTESTRERVVSLKGDGYFNVVHDRSHPFTVRAGSTTVRDVGTAFSVQSNENGVVTIVVDSGIVEIGSSRDSAVKGTRLGAKDRATVTNTGVVLVERAGQSADDLAWVQGRLVFRDTPLVQVGAELYRWYGVRLRVADSSLANLHLTASFSGEPIDKVLNIIALSLGARVERQGNIAILHRATAAPALR